ncbi:MAG: replication-associated recombination protein A, partial [Lachnospiraceae bacterium]|nr:replication-associated recombination protein A [Lachnospiraceae bacterium]
ELKPLTCSDIKILIDRAVYDEEKGLGALNIKIDDDAKNFLSDMSNGDARIALNAIELASHILKKENDGFMHLTLDVAKDCIGRHGYSYDKNGDMHYDTISAFIKSMRGSDPDAAVYYLARMLAAGEDIKFIARRMMILASEDIGLADPQALVIATSCATAVERIGLPESNLILSETAIYLAKAKKSNACCIAIENAMSEVKNSGNLPIPKHLQDAHYKGAKDLNRGIGYKYPHDYPGHYVKQQYLPDELIDERFYIEK